MQRALRLQGFTRTAAAIVVVCLAFVALLWLITLERIAYERTEAEKDAVTATNALALAFEERAARVLHAVDGALRMARRQHALHPASVDLDKALAESFVPDAITSLSIVDARGKVVRSTSPSVGVDLSDRDFFGTHAGTAGDFALVGKPVTGRMTGRAVIPVSRRVNGPGGNFAGVVLAGVDPGSFARFHDEIEIGERGVIELVGFDGISRMRRVGAVTTWGDDMKWTSLLRLSSRSRAGHFTTGGAPDGAARYMSYRVMGDYGLVAAVAASVDESLAGYFERRRGYLAGAAAGTLLALLLGAVLLLTRARQERARERSLQAEARYRATFDHAPIGIAQLGLDGRCLHVNPQFRAIHQRSDEELQGAAIAGLVHPEDRAEVERMLGWALHEGVERQETEVRHLCRDGACAWVLLTFTAVRGAGGGPEYLLAMARDVTQHKQAALAAQESQAQFHQLANHIPEAFWISGAGLNDVFYLSPAYDTICGRHFHSLDHAWREWRNVLHPEDRPRVLEAHARAAEGYLDLEHRIVRPDGEVRWVRMRGFPVPDAQGGVHRIAGTIQDFTAQKAAEEKLQHQAHFDLLTDLPNRLLLHDRMVRALSQARRKQWQLGVLVMDLDRFKAVNDTLGHARGDEVLREAARRVTATVRAEDTVARVGGDEFVVLLAEIHGARDAGKVAEKILDSLAKPFRCGEHEVFIGASAGVSIFPSDGDDAEALLKNADSAMYRAKELGRNGFQFYTAEMNARAMDRLLLEGDLRRALEREEFVLHLQPKARLADGTLAGFEALLRWRRAGKGLVAPGEFIPLLEESGLIVPVGEWVVRAACAQVRAWQDAGLVAQPIAVNVSARQFVHHDLYGVVDRALRDAGVHPSLLEIEITESDAMRDAEHAIQVVRRLKERGVTVSIDDFGTGYSSLGYLKRFPVDKLKLDRSFVVGLPQDPDDVSIANAVVSMAHSLGLEVVAEGVETEAQRAFLAANGCDQMQGYLLSRPLGAESCAALLQREPRIHAVASLPPRAGARSPR